MGKIAAEDGELAQRIKEQQAIAEMGQAIANILDLNELLHTVLVWTKNHFDLYLVNIALLDAAGENLIPFLGDNDQLNKHGLDFFSDVSYIPLISEPSICARVARERRVIVANDVYEHPDFLPHPLLPETRSELATPMIVADQLIGVMDIQAKELNRFTDADVRLFVTLTAQFGNAIQRARAYQQSERRATELTILNEMSRSLNSVAGIDALLTTFYRYVSRLIDTTNFFVAFYEPEKGKTGEIVFALQVESDVVRRWAVRRPFASSVTEYVIKTKQPLLIKKVNREAYQALGIDIAEPKSRSWLGVPMIVDDQVKGVVCVQNCEIPNVYNEDSQRLLVSMTNQVALAVENARLFAQLKDYSEYLELEVAERTMELTQTNDQLLIEISDRMEAEEALKVYAAELERSNHELQNFAYVVSHDLQEPLRKITSFGARVQERYEDIIDERGMSYLERMNSAAERMQQLINDLLSLSRVSTHQAPFELVELNQIMAEVLSDLEIRVEETAASVIVDSLPEIEGDPTQLRQLLQNLVGNALKFVREDVPPVVQVTSELFVKNGRNYVRLCIVDNGIGIEAQYLDRIFEVFERLHNKTEYEGSGVGLTICRKIVNRHQGKIKVESQLNQGTTFIITLPMNQEVNSEQS